MAHVARHRAPLHAVPDPGIAIFVDGDIPLITPGRYEAFGGLLQVFPVFNRKKAVVPWTVIVLDPQVEDGIRRVPLPRYYNIRGATRGHFSAGKHSDLVREWTMVVGRRPQRLDRLSPRAFEDVCCDVEVATVTTDRLQRPLDPLNYYSKVQRIIARNAGGSRL